MASDLEPKSTASQPAVTKRASCNFVIGKGNEVLAEADLTFNERDDIAPGESFMDTATFFTANLTFEDFDSDEFDLSDLYCNYRIR